ncbi:MAG: hypothetical protein AAGG48_11735 [Planctomycetota bacterium]
MTCRNVAVFAVLLFIFTPSNVLAANPITMSVNAVGWTVHEETGRVFATIKGKKQVVEYSSDGKEVRRFDVGVDPKEIILKRDLLIVSCTKSPSVYAIDLSKNEVIGSVKLNGIGAIALFCSQVDNPYVYAICKTGTSSWDSEVIQIDTKSMDERRRVKVRSWGQRQPIHVAMSRDGKWIVADARGQLTPSGADLMRVNEEECTFTQVRDYHTSFGPIVAGPRNRYWTFGHLLYTGDITKNLRAFKGSPVAIHPRVDLAASLYKDKVYLQRFSDSSDIDTIALELDTKTPSETTIRFDLKDNLVFVGTNQLAAWVDLKQYADDLLPLKMLSFSNDIESLVDQPLRIPIEVSNPDLEPKTKVVLKDGPKAARIQDGAFVWSPTADDVGAQTFQLEARQTDGTIADSAELSIKVRFPTVDLGFRARSMKLSHDSKYLIVWGPPSEESRGSLSVANGPEELVLINAETLEILAHKTISQGIRCATVDDRWVYIAPKSGNLFYRLDHKLTSDERQFLKSEPNELVKIASDTLAVIGRQLELFKVDPLGDRAKSASVNVNPNIQLPVQLISKETIQIGNRIIDYESGALVRCLTNTLPTLAETPVHGHPYSRQSNQQPKRWGRFTNSNTLTNHAGSQISQWSHPRFLSLSERWPAVIMIRQTANNRDRTYETRLELCNLFDGRIEGSSLIAFDQQQLSGVSFHSQRDQIIVDSARVFVIEGEDLVVAPIPVSIADAMRGPTYFTESQPTEINIGGTKTIKLGVSGPNKNVSYSLAAEFEGISIDSTNGDITIDTNSLWDKFLTRSVSSSRRISRGRDTSSASVNASEYEYLTGKKLGSDQLATQLPISVVLRDAEGQEDATKFALILLGSQKEIDARREQYQKEKERKQAEALAQQEEARRLAQERMEQAKTAREAANKASDSERWDRMETRLRRIEAVLDSILKKLEDE